MKKFIISQRRRNGFTLAEVLIVVAIIGILLAVALPNVIAYRQELKLAELDDDARTIFVAAQNELTALKNRGVDLEKLADYDSTTNSESVGTTNKSGDIIYISNKSTKFHDLVPAGSFETKLQSENYVVEFNPEYGTVYAVWYWEDSNFKYLDSAYKTGQIENPEERSNRRDAMVGYYGGTTVDRIQFGQMPIPEVDIINAEELQLKMKVPDTLTGVVDPSDIVVRVFINDEELNYDGTTTDNPFVIGPSYTGTVVLDTLKEEEYKTSAHSLYSGNWTFGMKFKSWGLNNTTPGDDITIRVELSHKNMTKDGKVLIPQSVTLPTVNSLFESVVPNRTTPVTYTANIAYGRHLQNLDNDEFGITKAVQTRTIDFKATGADAVYYWGSTYGYDTLKFIPINPDTLTEYDGGTYEIRFLNVGKPSDTSSDYRGLFGFLSNDVTFKDIILVNTMVEKGYGVGALVGFMANGSLDNCHVYLDEFNAAGSGLADKGARLTGTCVGGLVGEASPLSGSLTLEKCSASTVISSTNYAGGLVGNVGGDFFINKSYAACNITGAVVGGLVGHSNASTVEISGSYAAGTADIDTTAIGNLTSVSGLFNYTGTPTVISVTNSYAAVRYGDTIIDNNNKISVDGAYSGAGNNAYYVEQQGGVSYKTGSGEGKTSSDLAGMIGTTFTKADGWYAPTTGTMVNPTGMTYPYNTLTGSDLDDPYPYPMLLGVDSTVGTTGTDPMAHYGDWLWEEASYSSLCYYEVYDGTTPEYGVWGYAYDKNNDRFDLLNSLALGSSGKVAKEDGYCVAVLDGENAPKAITVDSGTSYTVNQTALATGVGVPDASGPKYNLYKIEGLDGIAIDSSYYHTANVGGKDYWFNPFFACEVHVPTAAGAAVPTDIQAKPGAGGFVSGTTPGSTEYNGQVVIRTARQLVWLGELTQGVDGDGNPTTSNPYFSSSPDDNPYFYYSYNQLLNVDYGRYDKDKYGTKFASRDNDSGTLQIPISIFNGGSSKAGSYNGNHLIVKGLKIVSSLDNVGFFGTTKGAEISNVRLVNTSIKGNSTTASASVGGLIGEMLGSSPKVTDCGIYIELEDASDYDDKYIIESASDNTGGLVGNVGNGATLTKCFAAVKVKGAKSAGGLAGFTETGAKFNNCYSGGHTKSGIYERTNANVTGTSNVGGLIGQLGSNNTFEGVCYSTCSVGEGVKVGKLIGIGTYTKPTSGDIPTLYAVGKAFDSSGNEITTTAVGLNEETYLGDAGSRTATTGFVTYAYDLPTLKDKDYPYQVWADQTEYHGDWELPVEPCMAYVEFDSTGSIIGAYAVEIGTGTTTVTMNSLGEVGSAIAGDGYRILYPKRGGDISSSSSVTIDGGTQTGLTNESINYTDSDTGVEYDVYSFKSLNPGSDPRPTSYYSNVKVTVAGEEFNFIYNPYFACEAFDVTEAGASVPSTTPYNKPGAGGENDRDNSRPTATGVGTYNDHTGVVIRTARQLVYVSKFTNGWKETTTGTGIAAADAQSWKYEQVCDVDFSTYLDEYGSGATLTGGAGDGSSVESAANYGTFADGTAFVPIKLNGGSYDGNNHTISNLYVGPGVSGYDTAAGTTPTIDGTAPTGLFGSVDGAAAELEKVTLVDVNVNGVYNGTAGTTPSVSVGGLVGALNGGSVQNCGIYTSNNDYDDYYNKWKVVGDSATGSTSSVGGLIGTISGGSVSNSYAAVKVTGEGSTTVGGFVGTMATGAGSVSNCYAGGYVGDSGHYEQEQTNVSSGNGLVGGFVGSVEGGEFGGTCYSTASVGNDRSTTTPADVGLFAGSGTPAKSTTSGTVTLYAVAKAFDTKTDGTVMGARDESGYLESAKKSSSPSHVDGTTSYNKELEGKDYPYPEAGTVAHHGDWIGLTEGVYFETTTSGAGTEKTGYYGNGKDGGNIGADGLATRPADVVTYATDDGYMFLSEEDLGDVAIGINGEGFVLEKSGPEMVCGGTYYVYRVPADGLNTMPKDDYYFTVSVNGQFFTANFAFAGEIFNDGTVTDLSTPAAKSGLTSNDVAIRSARQLSNAGIWTSRSEKSGAIVRGLKYEQLLDIDYDAYKDASEAKMPKIYDGNMNGTKKIEPNHVPITLSKDASYEGHGYEIRGLEPGYLLDKDSSGTFALNGLFGRVKEATISNVNLINPRVVGYSGNKAVAQFDETVVGTMSLPLGGGPVTIANGDNVMEEGKTYTLNPSDDFTENGTSKSGTDTINKFVIYWGGNGRVGDAKSSISFSDGASFKTEFDFNATTSSANLPNRSVEFETAGKATVKIWWYQDASDTSRRVVLYGADYTEIGHTAGIVKNESSIDTFQIDEAGKYYIGTPDGTCKFCKIVVTVDSSSGGGGTIPTPPDPPVTTDDYVDGALLAKGILAPIAGPGFEIGNSAKVRVGALAGILDTAMVNDSGAYVDDQNPDYPSADDAYNQFIVKNAIEGSEDAVGGFAGNVAGSTVERCYSAVKVIGVRTAGGFAGKIGGTTTVTDSYVGGHTLEGSYIYGDDSAPKVVKNVETTHEFSGTGNASNSDFTYTGGFAGKIEGSASFSGVNYTTASVAMNNLAYKESVKNDTSKEGEGDGDYHTVTITGNSKIGTFAGDAPAGFTVDPTTTTLYATGVMYNDAEDEEDGKLIYSDARIEYKDFSYTKEPASGKKNWERDTNVFVLYANQEDYLDQTVTLTSGTGCGADKYDDTLTDWSYPYKSFAGQTIHHGDWTVRYDLVYYEAYEDSNPGLSTGGDGPVQVTMNGVKKWVGFYAVLRDSTNPEGKILNTLLQEGIVVDSGYMIFTDSADSHITFGISATYGGKRADGKQQFFKSDDRIELPSQIGLAKYAYIIKFETLNLAPSDTYYQQVTINGLPYILNQHFACEAVNVGLIGTDGKLDYDTIRAKPGLKYNEIERSDTGEIKSTYPKELTKDDHVIVIRSPWNLASMARYTRDGNESIHKANARTWTYVQTMDIDYAKYADGHIYDGNVNNRSEPYRTMYLAGTNYAYGQAPAMLEGGGKYDGNGHTISNLYVSSDSTKKDYVGLFGRIAGEDTAGNMTTVQNVHMVNYHVNAWGGPDTGIYVGGIVGEIADGAVLENVTLDTVEMDFHEIPLNDTDKKTDTMFEAKRSNTVKFNAVGSVVGRVVSGEVKKVRVNGLSIDFSGSNYSYTNDSVKIGSKTDWRISQQAGTGGSLKYGSSATVNTYDSSKRPTYDNEKNCVNVSIGGVIGSIEASGTGEQVKISNAYIVNPTIKANKGQENRVGGFIGSADGGDFNNVSGFDPATSRNITIQNCGVYLEGDGIEKYGDNGVVSTYEQAMRGRNAVGPDVDHNVDLVGGFIGRADPFVKIDNSFAAVRVSGLREVGGFAGHLEGAEVKNSFAGGHTENGAYPADANVTATNASGYAGGFVGDVEGKNSNLRLYGVVYSTCSVGGDGSVGAFVGRDTRTDAMSGAVRDAKDEGKEVTLYSTAEYAGTSSKTLWDEATGYGLLTKLNLPTGNADECEKYDSDSSGSGSEPLPAVYPYKSGTTFDKDGDGTLEPTEKTHFGDWIDHRFAGVFYYEKEDGEYHFYTVKTDIGAGDSEFSEPASDLCTERDGKDIEEWGYGYFMPSGDTVAGATCSVSGGSTGSMSEPEGDLKTATEAMFGSKGVTIMTIAGSTSNVSTEEWTFTYTESGTPYTEGFYVNRSYAAAIEGKGTGVPASTLGTADNKYQIRNVEQLDNIPDSSPDCFKLTHDVDASGYTGYTGATGYTGTFDGANYRILNLSSGLFESLADGANVEKVILYAPDGYDSVTFTGQGGIASTSSGNVSITNTVVAGYTIGSSGGDVGGLVGTVSGGSLTIEKSSATNKLSGGNAGGLVGNVSGGTLDVKNSYAGGEITSADSSAGGLVGASGGSVTITYEDVYSFVDMAGLDVTKQMYGIGPNVDTTAKETIAFWGGGVSNPNTEDQALGVALAEIASRTEADTTATSSLVPGASGLEPVEGGFPYPEYSTNEKGEPTHYGSWTKVVSTSGYFYFEKEKVGSAAETYHFYGYGAELVEIADENVVRGTRIFDTLCYDRHTTERASITESGYGFFSASANGATQSGLAIDGNADSTLKTALCKELGIVSGDYDIKTMDSAPGTYSGAAITGTVSYTEGTVELDLYPAFGAGIYAENQDIAKTAGGTQFVVRTPEQLQNVVGNANVKDKVAVTHDIDFKGSDYKPGTLYASEFDGGEYRLIDFGYTGSGSGDAALFTGVSGETTIKNVIMYAPGNDGKISGTNAAGLVAKADSKLTIDNCAVAGYEITGSASVGGLVGSATTGTIDKSEAVVTLNGGGSATSIGGLAGSFSGTIENSYSGGKVTGAGSATVGGIVGSGLATVNNSYTYMDLTTGTTGASVGNIYPIGKDATVGSGCYYCSEYFDGTTNANQGTGKSFSDMMVEKTSNDSAESVFVPDAGNGLKSWGELYPLGAAVSVDGTKVHYGAWPEVAGIAQWELVGSDYKVSIIGVDVWGKKLSDELNKGDLSEKVDASGFAVFMTSGKALEITGNPTLKDGANELSGDQKDAVLKAINAKLSEAGVYGVASGASKVYDNKDLVGKADTEATVTVKNPCAAVKSATLHYNPGTNGVGYEAFSSTAGTAEFKVRTAVELDGIPDNVPSDYVFKQTCDIDGKSYTDNGTDSGNAIYTGAKGFKGTYDGQGHVIRDLAMSGTGGDVGLFADIDSSATIKNVVMYSPNGVTISGEGSNHGDDPTNDHYGVGGLVGSIGSNGAKTATIENCVVAGYTIKGEQYVGGIVGWGFYGANIKNCAAVNEITCNATVEYSGAGGILGGYGSNSAARTEITNCYSGGKITVSGTNASSAKVGGIAGVDGSNDHAIVKNCYTYVDFSGCGTAANVYTISVSANESNTNNYYLNDDSRIPTGCNKQGTGKIYSELKSLSIEGFGAATESYVPTNAKGGSDQGKGTDKMTDNFPFPAAVRTVGTDGSLTNTFVHYGEWPATTSGAPGISEGPGVMAVVGPEAIVPERFEVTEVGENLQALKRQLASVARAAARVRG